MNNVTALSDRFRGLKPWKPGQSGNPAGRKPGSRNKLTEAFLKALCDDFEANGVDAIAAVRLEDPAAYVKVIAMLCPKELEMKRPLGDLSDDELLDSIDALQRFVLGSPDQDDAGGGGGEAA